MAIPKRSNSSFLHPQTRKRHYLRSPALHCTHNFTSLIHSPLGACQYFTLLLSIFQTLSVTPLCHTFKYLPSHSHYNTCYPLPSLSTLFNPTRSFREMATITTHEKKLEHLKEEEEEEQQQQQEEEIEALSLCDLPLDDEDPSKSKPADSRVIETQEDFDFQLWGAPFSAESEMCAADEVFFQGQILPLRFQQLKRCESMSEFRSNSSRSSSVRSQNSSSSSYSYSTTATTSPRISKPRIQNHLHSHPSPLPQLKVTLPRQTSFVNHGRKSSSAWEFFRLGVVPAPEIALQDLKVRGTNSVNKNYMGRSSNVNSSTNSTVKTSYRTDHSGKKNHVLEKFAGIGSGFWSGCKCSVETVQSDTVMIKSGTKSSNKTESTTLTHATKEKVVERKRQKHRKRTMSHRRTSEWIKELSHGSYPDDEALLSKS